MGSPPSGKVLRFGPFELDLQTQQLRRAGALLRIQPQPFKVLSVLVDRAGEVVTRDRLRHELWGDETFVDFEQGLNYCIRQIRAVLGDEAQTPRWVETIPRRGYRFIAPVETNGELTLANSNPETIIETKKTSGAHVWRILVASALVLIFAAVAYLARVRSTARLTANDSIVIADFTNLTGDPLLDDTLKEALTIHLQQSPFLNILSDQRIAATLKLMNRPGERLTVNVAREVCLRSHSKAMLTASIALVGNRYVIGLRANDCQSGDVFASAEAYAANRDGVMDALEKAGNQIREKLGESLASIKTFDKPLREATTSSLEALKLFSVADPGKQESLVNYQRAVQLDPDFAVAYAGIGTLQVNFGQMALARESFKKAFELRDRVSEHERFYIDSSYYTVTTGQMEQANHTYLEWTREYPNDSTAYGNLGFNYIALGDYEKALQATREALRFSHDNTIWSTNLVTAYMSLSRMDEAKAVLDQALAQDPNDDGLHSDGYYLAFLSHDEAKMQEHAAWASGKPGFEDGMFATESDTAAYYGRLSEAGHLSQRAVDSANRNDENESAAFWEASEALRLAEFGDSSAARRFALHALSVEPTPGVRLAVALAMARSGDAERARKLADALGRDFPVDTLIQAYWLPTIRSAIELDRGRPSYALELLEQTQPYELAQTLQFQVATMYPVYLKGLAYLRVGQPGQAFVEFRKVLDHRHAVSNFPLASLVYLQLARAKAARHDTDARLAYQDFLTLWKDADPDVPILKDAKAEYANLQ